MVLLDTCALLWWTLDPQRLSAPALAACRGIEKDGDGVLSSISIWEVGIQIRNRQLDIGMPLERYHRLLESMGTLEIVPVDAASCLKSLALDWDNRDPADRTIVALAMLRDLAIVTRDEGMRSYYPDTVW